MAINFRTNTKASVPISMAYDNSPIDQDTGIIYAAVVLLGLYILIVFEVKL